jgi:lysophospholipase L1-like esterase
MTTYSYRLTKPSVQETINGILFLAGVNNSYSTDQLALNQFVPDFLDRYVDGVLSNQDLVTPFELTNQQKAVYSAVPSVSWTGIADRLRKLKAQFNLTNNVVVNPVMATPPTIYIGTSNDTSLTNAYEWLDPIKRNAILWCGGEEAVTQTSWRTFPSTDVGAATPNSWRVTAVVDADVVQFNVWHRTTTTVFRVSVDGQYTSLAGINDPTANNAQRYIKLTFASRAVREITIECHGPAGFRGFYVKPTCTIWKPTNRDVVTAYFTGDSYTDGADATLKWDGFVRVAAQYLGWDDIRTDGIGGTGYIQTLSASQREFIGPGRLGYILRASPDVHVICGGYNDRSYGYAAIKASVQAYYAALRADPRTEETFLFFLGVHTGVGTDAELLAAEAAIYDAYIGFNDIRAFFIPQQTDPAGRWFSGTGYDSAPVGNGNLDIYGSGASAPLGVHINTLGHKLLGRRVAVGIVNAINERLALFSEP